MPCCTVPSSLGALVTRQHAAVNSGLSILPAIQSQPAHSDQLTEQHDSMPAQESHAQDHSAMNSDPFIRPLSNMCVNNFIEMTNPVFTPTTSTLVTTKFSLLKTTSTKKPLLRNPACAVITPNTISASADGGPHYRVCAC